jgi:DNA-binding winged helix-turn-helix (wHTH) protein/TolB-like protein
MSIRFAEFELTDSGDLIRKGVRLDLQPQPTKVLQLLASRPGELIPRSEIQRHVWGPETHVDFEQGLNWCIKRVRDVLGDDAGSPRFVETVPRRGYRFITPISPETPRVGPRWRPPRIRLLAVSLLAAAAALLAARQWWRDSGVTVLVIPFDNLGTEERLRAVEDVATEEMISTLAVTDVRKLRVIDPLTAMKFKRSQECILTLGRQVDAQFVMTGAVRTLGSDLRTTAQLFRVADNRQVWAGEQLTPISGDPGAGAVRMARDVASRLASGARLP